MAAIKIIKFDLPINGIKVTTLEALRDNLTDEIVPLARSGQLERWFKSRQLQEQAQAVAAAVSQHTKDKALFLALCAVLELEVHPDDASAIFDAPPKAGHYIKNINYFHLYQELKDSYEEFKSFIGDFIEKEKIKKQENPVGIKHKVVRNNIGQLINQPIIRNHIGQLIKQPIIKK